MKNLFRTNSILVLIIYFFLNPAFTFSQIQTGNFIFEGVPRDYIIFLPQNYNGVDKLPLVFNLHGGSLNAQQQLDYSKMNEVADTVGFIVVYPNAVLTAWSCGINLTEGHVNDVGFIDALIDTLANNYSVDEERIYCCGFSLGGFMCHRLACELSNRIAAIADVAGSIAQHFTTDSTTAHPMPVLKFHGTADQIIPYDGKNEYCSVQQTLTYWANFNHCNLPDTTLLINIDPLDGCTVQKIKYSFSQDIGEVVHYKVLNGGHSWPGGDTAYFTHLGAGPIGNTTMDINASELIWDFFKNYKNPLVDLAYIKSFELSRKYKYYSLSNDTLTVNAYLANPKGHQVVVYAFYQADGSDYQDSLELFDDGLHNDGNASDNFFSGSKHLQNLDEDNYTVELKTYDSNIDKSIKFYLSDQFTTTGPLSVDSIVYAPLSNFRYSVKPFIKNRGSAVSISNIQVKIFSDDPWVTQVYPDYRTCATIAPGEIKPVTQLFAVDYDSTSFPGYFNLKFEISSNRISYWIDSSMMVVTGVEDIKLLPTEYSLYQNYPNPFNPMTTIKYSIPKLGFVTIKVFDVLGSEITTLLNEEKSAGTYELNWNATQLPSGVYFYQLKAGSYVETKKMILLK
jgi:polyhydroxybutyrate depolymerase